jgi:hypothetical protein
MGSMLHPIWKSDEPMEKFAGLSGWSDACLVVQIAQLPLDYAQPSKETPFAWLKWRCVASAKGLSP